MVPFLVAFRSVVRGFHGHEEFLESLLDIRRVLLEALVDGGLRFRFRLLENGVAIDGLGDGRGAVVGGVELSVAFLRVIGGAGLVGLFHAIPDHGGFRARLHGKHAPVLQFHLLAA